MQTYKHLNDSVVLLNYHLVWISKRRRKILVGPVAERLTALLYEKCKELALEILAIEIQSDHVPLFVNALPRISPQDIVFRLKGYTARMIRKEFPHLLYLPSLWTNSYFVSTAGNVSSDTIRRYIEGHDTR